MNASDFPMTTLPPPIVEKRCPECGTLLFKARLPPGVWIEIVCYRCPGPKPKIVIERKAA